MSTPILATKLYIPPPRPKIVFRPRLIERLNEGLYRKLTLISAPAGFGKTTLVSGWVAAPKGFPARPVAWLSLDDGDNDSARFLAYLVAALQTIPGGEHGAEIGEGVLGLLQSPQPPPIESILTTLLNEITTIGDDFVVVLDDYHVIDTQAVDNALTFLLEHLPPQMHLVIATREDPPLPLARLRARGQLTELRATDLRFTPAEAAGFLNEVMGLELSMADVAALESRTEGWIAGLQLAALSMQGRDDAASFVSSFTGSHHFVLDYLVEEVLHRQPERVQIFLLYTSILDRLCGPLCDAVMLEASAADVSGQETLEYIEHANLFLVPLDNERRWYRYHHLFADLLHQRLHDGSPESSGEKPGTPTGFVAELHSRASVWYENNGLVIDAYHHAAAAEDFERAANLAERAHPVMDGTFQSATWLGWVQELPEELIRARPVLSVAYAWALLDAGEMEASEAWLRAAERWLDVTERSSVEELEGRSEMSAANMVVADEEQFCTLPASIATARAYRAQALGDIPDTVNYARKALGLISEGEHVRRGVAAALLGLAYWTNGDLEIAHQALADGMASFQKAGTIIFALSGTFGMADIRVAQGRLNEAVRTYEQALQLVSEQDDVLPVTADLFLGLSLLHHERGNVDTAAEHLTTSKEQGEHATSRHWQYRLRHAQAQMKESQGDLDGALTLLDEAERYYVRNPLPDVRPVAALRARVWVRQGRLSKAQEWARGQGLSVDDVLNSVSYIREFEYIVLARIHIAEYRQGGDERALAEALGLLARLLDAAEAGERMGSVIEILVVQALAHEAQEDIPAALVSLERALLLAEPEGYVRIFVDEGTPMARLLYQALSDGVESAYVRRLLAAFPVAETEQTIPATRRRASGGPAAPSSGPEAEVVEPLSEREIEVLQLIAEGLTNQEVATRLYLSLHTVKVHARNIYGKLGVKNRTQAVARGKALGILSQS